MTRSVLLALAATIACQFLSPASAQTTRPAFEAGSGGAFTFDTGALRGRFQVDAGAAGLLSLVDAKSGLELTRGKGMGLLQCYRLLSVKNRYGDAIWAQPKSASLREGALQIDWPGSSELPARVTLELRWASADTLDATFSLTAEKPLSGLELFIGSYFADRFRNHVYLRPALYAPGKPAFAPADAHPLIVGTYLAFPRDWQSAQLFYDGRWQVGKNPVEWSIMRLYAAPLAMQVDKGSGIACVLMSRPQDCFGINMPYNMDPPDGVAGHHSTYLSLFGGDFTAGQTATAHARLLVAHNLTPEQAVDAYESFLRRSR